MVALVLLVILAGTFVISWFLVAIWAWLIAMVLFIVILVILGRVIDGVWIGLLIDPRNKVSLARFQTVLWTILVVSSFLVAAVHNVRYNQPNPLGITVPTELWILLGVSSTALVGAGLIKQEKAKQEPKTGKTTDGTAEIVSLGVLAANSSPDQARWAEMFRSDEIGGERRLDIGKVQMFYFTLIIVFAYAVAVGGILIRQHDRIAELPALNPGAIALLGISHAAYLATKAVSSPSTVSS